MILHPIYSSFSLYRYTEEALHILKQKKSKNYVILQGNPDFSPPVIEYRELYGIGLAQRRNDVDPLGQYTIITNNERAKVGYIENIVRDIFVVS